MTKKQDEARRRRPDAIALGQKEVRRKFKDRGPFQTEKELPKSMLDQLKRLDEVEDDD